MHAGEVPPFSEQLRQLRQAAGLTQEELAERAGLSVKAISALERGRRQRPYPHTVRALADALGLSEPERADLTRTMPARSKQITRPSISPQPGLPAAPAALIGRDRELDDVISLLKSGTARAVTLTGAGGVGKSRLALEVALRLAQDYDGRTAFVPLAPLNSADLVLQTVAMTLGLAETGDRRLLQVLAAHFDQNSWLLVLDNIEHVLDSASDVANLLASSPGLSILSTGRAAFRIRAEHEYPLRPLDLPDLSAASTLEDVSQAGAVQLFRERARAAVPGFDLTQGNYAAVATVCRRLDGLPLALELVAARVRYQSPNDLLARLDNVLPLLVGGSRDLPARQQTMEAAINWSIDLLRTREQALFRRLAIFAGGWTLEAAEAVSGWGDIPTDDVLELLSALVEQSLVIIEAAPDEPVRYRMLEPIRQFAARLLHESGEREQLADRQLIWCLHLVQRASAELRGPNQQQWLDQLEREHDNLRSALSWSSQERAHKEQALRLATGLWRFWETRGHLTEGRRWLEQALAESESLPADLRAEALNAAGNLARDQGDHVRAVLHYESSLAIWQELGDPHGMAQALNNLGNVMLDQGHYERATVRYAEALLYFRELSQEWDIANALNNLGLALGHRGEYEQATRLLEEAISLRERMNETVSLARSLDALGVIKRKQGLIEDAGRLHETSLGMRRDLGDRRGVAISLNHLGLVALYQEDLERAANLIDESLNIRGSIGDRYGSALSLRALAEVRRRQGRYREATSFYKEALVMHQQLGINEEIADCLLGLAAIALAGNDTNRAARLVGAGEALRETMRQAVPLVDRTEYDRVVSSIQATLTPEVFAELRDEGRVRTLEQSIADALSVNTTSI